MLVSLKEIKHKFKTEKARKILNLYYVIIIAVGNLAKPSKSYI